MSIYKPLANFLAARKSDRWEASFAEIEQALGRALPPSAYRHQAWWANLSAKARSQTYGWRSVGWRTTALDLEHKRVVFERARERLDTAPARDGDALAPLIAQAMAVSGIAGRDAVLAEALRRFIADEAAQGLIALGGTAPDFVAAPRERPKT